MKPSELLKQITTLLSAEAKIELAQVTTVDGVVLEADSFESGMPVFQVTENGNEPLPKGEYKLEDGKTLVLVEDGVIDAIVEAETETEIEVEAAEEVKPEEVIDEEVKVEAVSQEEIIKAVVDAIIPMLEEMKSELAEVKMQVEEYKKTKMSKVVHTPERPTTQTIKTPKANSSVLESIMSKL